MYKHIPPGEPLSPSDIAAKLISECQEFEHLKDGEACIRFLMDTDETIKHGRRIIGSANMPTVQGNLKGVFDWLLHNFFQDEHVDFLIILELDYWEAADDRMREILVFHELCHCIHKKDRDGDPRYDETGRPVWGLLNHDLEEFNATVRRYGAYSEDVRAFIAAAGEGNGGR